MNHPDEQARELAQQIVNELNEKCVLVDLEGTHLGFDPDDGYPLVESIVTALLAKARLAEAEWWFENADDFQITYKECRERLERLRQAAGEGTKP